MIISGESEPRPLTTVLAAQLSMELMRAPMRGCVMVGASHRLKPEA